MVKEMGKEKKYDNDGRLRLEGEYINDKEWTGKGKEYDEDDEKLIFEIEYLNGEKFEE